MNLAPIVIERDGRGERAIDIWSLLMRKRIVFLGTAIDDAVANLVVAQLLYLQSEDSKTPIELWVNSPGGSVSAGLAIYDAMQFVSAPIHTTCVGLAASMGAVILAGGENGRRRSLPHAKIMIHQPWGGFQGQASDVAIHAEQILQTKKLLNGLLAKATGKDLAQVEIDADRDKYFTADEAKDYGLIDEIVEATPSLDK